MRTRSSVSRSRSISARKDKKKITKNHQKAIEAFKGVIIEEHSSGKTRKQKDETYKRSSRHNTRSSSASTPRKKYEKKAKSPSKKEIKLPNLMGVITRNSRKAKTQTIQISKEEIEISDDSVILDENAPVLGKRQSPKINDKQEEPKSHQWRFQGSHSPLRSILKTSPMYSPIKSFPAKKNITIREESNTMKNFTKDRSSESSANRSEKSEQKLSSVAHSELVNASEIVQVCSQISAKLKKQPPMQSVIKSASKIRSEIFEVSFSTNKPTYITKEPNSITKSICRRELSREYLTDKDFIEVSEPSSQKRDSENHPVKQVRSPIRKLIEENTQIDSNYIEFKRELELMKQNMTPLYTPNKIQVKPSANNSLNFSKFGSSPSPMRRISSPLDQNNLPAVRSSSPLSQISLPKVQQKEDLFIPETVDYSQSTSCISSKSLNTKLRSVSKEDVKENAILLLDILKSFSLSFNLDLKVSVTCLNEIMNENNDVNVEELRRRMAKKSNLL